MVNKNVEYALMRKCSNIENVKLMVSFLFREDSQKHLSECKQCMSKKRKDWRNNKYEKAKSYTRK